MAIYRNSDRMWSQEFFGLPLSDQKQVSVEAISAFTEHPIQYIFFKVDLGLEEAKNTTTLRVTASKCLKWANQSFVRHDQDLTSIQFSKPYYLYSYHASLYVSIGKQLSLEAAEVAYFSYLLFGRYIFWKFHNFRASKSGDWRSLFSSKTWLDRWGCSKIVKCSVGSVVWLQSADIWYDVLNFELTSQICGANDWAWELRTMQITCSTHPHATLTRASNKSFGRVVTHQEFFLEIVLSFPPLLLRLFSPLETIFSIKQAVSTVFLLSSSCSSSRLKVVLQNRPMLFLLLDRMIIELGLAGF